MPAALPVRDAAGPLLQLQDVEMIYRSTAAVARGFARSGVRAVDGVSLTMERGETLALVGESGCGKSSLARCIVRLNEPTAGAILFEGRDITHLSRARLRPLRRHMQLIFQDPFASLNPRRRIGDAIAAALRLHRTGGSASGHESCVEDMLKRVGLATELADRLPGELSGGQRQRAGIARALAPGPKLIVADEPVSALDVSVQAGILNLLKDLRDELGLTMLFISHDLGVVRHVSDRVGVMYLGRLVEMAPADDFYAAPRHPYSAALLSAVPLPDPEGREARRAVVLEGDVPSSLDPPRGCRFHTRCPRARPLCSATEPALSRIAENRSVACHFPLETGGAFADPDGRNGP